MNKNNKRMIPFLVLAAIGSFLYIGPKQSRNEMALKELDKQKKKIEKINNEKIPTKKAVSRSIASVPKPKALVQKREIIGAVTNLKNVRIVNKENKDWKKIYTKSFLRMLGKTQISDFKIELKNSLLKVDKNIAQNMEHIIVSYKKPNGDPTSFEALIDSETGHAVQTWNQTRFEHRHPVTLSGFGKEFKED